MDAFDDEIPIADLAAGDLEIEFTFDDPKTFTKPWTGKKVFQLQAPGFEMKEQVICEEYRKLGLRKDGYEFIRQ